jgi:hypothetical protein
VWRRKSLRHAEVSKAEAERRKNGGLWGPTRCQLEEEREGGSGRGSRPTGGAAEEGPPMVSNGRVW